MKTQIFKNYNEFSQREDKLINGVSPDFVKENPNYEVDNKTNEGCWNCSDCSDCRYCSDCSSCSYCSYCRYCSDCSYCSSCSYCSYCRYCSDCSYCSYCSYCSDCSDCRYCSDCSSCSSCSYCSYCSYCSEKENEGGKMVIPKIENIHQKVWGAIKVEGNELKMDSWHTCDTTHCRAGWVVILAGEEGKALEKLTDTVFAAMQIYKESSPIKVSPTRFYETNDVAMADIIRCANEEMEATK